MAAMLACGISHDPVMARRTIKTLVSGDSGTSKKKKENVKGETAQDENALTSLPPKPPPSFGHQEYVGTCKLAARLAALAELQLATVDPNSYSWWNSAGVVSTSSNIQPKMRKSLEKSLRPHLPVLLEFWLAMLRDQVSLRARARAVRSRRSSVSSGAMYVIPAPRNSLLEHNEDSGQARPIFDTLWPHIAQAVSTLVGTSVWANGERGESSLHLILGVCLRYLSNGPKSVRGMGTLFNNDEGPSAQNATLLPIGMRCLHAVRWCMSSATVSSDGCEHIALDLVHALSSGVGASENTSSPLLSTLERSDAVGGRLASLVMVSSMIREAVSSQEQQQKKKKKKKKQQEKNQEKDELFRPLDLLLLDMKEDSRALPDHAMAHTLLEWACKSVHTDIPSVTVPVGGSSASARGLTSIYAATTNNATSLPASDPNRLLVVSAALDLIGLVLQHAHPDVPQYYQADAMSLYLRCLRALIRPDMWPTDSALDAAMTLGRTELIRSMHELQNVLLLRTPSLSNMQGIVQRILSSEEASPRGIACVLSITTDVMFSDALHPFIQMLHSTAEASVVSRHGTLLFTKNLLLGKENRQLKEEERRAVLARIGPIAIESVYNDNADDMSLAALTLVGCAAGRDPGTMLTPFLSMLCDTPGSGERNGQDATIRQLTLRILRGNGAAFKESVQLLPVEQQNILQSFIRSAMKVEAESGINITNTTASTRKRHAKVKGSIGNGDGGGGSGSGGVKKTRKKKKKKKLKL